jgi:hypothetical protein
MTLSRAEVKRAVKIYAGITVGLVALAAVLGGSQQAVSALFGSLILLVSTGVLLWSLLQGFEKKSFALAGIVIVIKYLLLAASLYWICTRPWVSLTWLAAGVGSVVLVTAFFGLTHQSEDIG